MNCIWTEPKQTSHLCRMGYWKWILAYTHPRWD